jgi:hypothetical protein
VTYKGTSLNLGSSQISSFLDDSDREREGGRRGRGVLNSKREGLPKGLVNEIGEWTEFA